MRAWACSCAVSPSGDPPCQSAWRYEAVFTGMVTEISDPGMPTVTPGSPPPSPHDFPQKKVRIRITEALVGLDANQTEVVIETGLGGVTAGMPSAAASTISCTHRRDPTADSPPGSAHPRARRRMRPRN